MTSKNVKSIDSKKNDLKVAKENLAKKEAELKAEIKKLQNELKAQAKVEKEESKAIKAEEAVAEAEDYAKRLKEVYKQPKANMTEAIRALMLDSKTVDEIAEATGYSRKAIADRRWLIIKSLEKAEANIAKS